MISKRTTWLPHNDRDHIRSYLPHPGKRANMPLLHGLAMASNSFNKFALFKNRGILGWSIMLIVDWLMWRLSLERKFLDSKKICFMMNWQPLLYPLPQNTKHACMKRRELFLICFWSLFIPLKFLIYQLSIFNKSFHAARIMLKYSIVKIPKPFQFICEIAKTIPVHMWIVKKSYYFSLTIHFELTNQDFQHQHGYSTIRSQIQDHMKTHLWVQKSFCCSCDYATRVLLTKDVFSIL